MNNTLFNGLNAIRREHSLSYRERKSLEECLSRELAAPRIKTWSGFSNRIHRVLVALQQSRKQRGIHGFTFPVVEEAANDLLKNALCEVSKAAV